MADVVARKCPNCGAELPPAGGASRIKCEFCGREVEIRQPAPPPQSKPAPFAPAPFQPQAPFQAQPFAPAQVVIAPPQRKGGAGCSIAFSLVIVLIVAGVGLYATMGSVPGGAGGFSFGGVAAPRLTWKETVGLFQVNGDGVEDPIFVVRTPDSGDELHVAVFDGASMSQIWRAGPYGTYSQGYQYTHAAVLGNRVLVTDFRAQGHLHDLASGTEVATVPLPDRAKRLCPSPAGGTQVWLEVENGSHAVVETATGASQPAPAAPWACPERDDDRPPWRRTRSAPAVAVPGFQAEELVSDGQVSVAVGKRAAGIRVPMAVGLGPDGRTPTWTMVPLSVDESLYVEDSSHPTVWAISAGRLYVAYSLQNDMGRLAALDARTGARVWEGEIPKCCAHGVDVDRIRVGPTRIVTEQFGQAEVWDAATGRIVGRITPWPW